MSRSSHRSRGEPEAEAVDQHAFLVRPHRTLLALSLPVMLSLIAEPLAGLVDTAYVERIGVAPAAALGAATAVLSSVVWVFNFLGVGTQTEVARELGAGRRERARGIAGLALVLGALLGTLVALALWPATDRAAAFMSDSAEIRSHTETYLSIRLLGFPPMLMLLAGFGALRGLQAMRAPMWIAAGMSLQNIALDAVLIFGLGPVPALGIAGAAWATVASQVVAAAAALLLVRRRLGWTREVDWRRARGLLRVGRDMFLRTGALLFFLLIGTRAALQSGAEAGAAHQALRQVWMLLAFLLDAYAASAQSLIGYFIGAGQRHVSRRVARVGLLWGIVSGVVIAAVLLAIRPWVEFLLVPDAALPAFRGAWWLCALAQPLNAVSFVTDGIHWGTRDYAYLRNVMLLSSGLGLAGLLSLTPESPLYAVWVWTSLWIAVRAVLGWVRVWPGVGRAPLASRA